MHLGPRVRLRTGMLMALLVVLASCSSDLRAEIYGFSVISPANNPGLSDTLATQLTVEVKPYGAGAVFEFSNNIASPYFGIIKEVYFDDGTLLGISALLEDDPGVDFFNNPAKESNLPGGENLTPDFEKTVLWAAKDGSESNGVDPGETLGVVFELKPGTDFDGLIAAIEDGFVTGGEGSLRIGLHLGSIADAIGSDSDSFIMTRVPVPGAALLGFLGLAAAGIRLRRYA